MKAAVISLGSTSSVWVGEALQKYFDQVDMLQLKKVEIDLGKDAGVFYEGKPLPYYDCVYLKGSFRYTQLLRSIATFLERKIPYMPLSPNSFTVVHNKLLTHLALQQENIPMPRTYLSPTIEAAKELLKKIHFPIVMKFPEGTQGKGVMFADSHSSASSLLDALSALKQPFIIQEYIETEGTDIRAFVIGDKVVAAMKRTAQQEEKRANMHAGGVGEQIQLSREAATLAVKTARVLQADICGIDILESPLGPLVIEANISPGLQGLSKVSPVNIADEIARFLYVKTQEMVTGKKKEDSSQLMDEINNDHAQEIITKLVLRGEKIILPEFVTKISKFDDRKEYVIKVTKGKVDIEPTS